MLDELGVGLESLPRCQHAGHVRDLDNERTELSEQRGDVCGYLLTA